MSDQLRRAVRTGVAVTSAIGLATAYVSYIHALDVVRMVGTTGTTVYIVPLFADGLIMLCSTALYAAAQAGAGRPRAATGGLVFGIGVTIAMNVAAGVSRGAALMLVDALAPVVFLISLEVLIWLFRSGRGGQPGDSLAQCPHQVPSGVEEAVRTDYFHRRDCLGEQPSYMAHGARWGVDRRKVPELVGAALNGSARDA